MGFFDILLGGAVFAGAIGLNLILQEKYENMSDEDLFATYLELRPEVLNNDDVDADTKMRYDIVKSICEKRHLF